MKKFEKVNMMIRVKPETRMIMENERLDSGQSFGQLVDNWAKIVTHPKICEFIATTAIIGEKLIVNENGKDSTIIS